MKLIDVNGFEIGGDKTFIIADIASNHKQDLSLAKESVTAASEAGADAIKFQSIQLSELYLNPNKTTSEFVKQLEFAEEWHQILKSYCDERNILFFSSPTYLKSVDLLEDINVKLYKLASAQIGTFPQLVEKVAKLLKPTIFSTGLTAYDEVIKAVNIFKRNKNDNFIILHCNSIYPTEAKDVNLQLIQTYKDMFGNPVGFSDHTIGTHIACAAVTMGASVIEKHFTIDRNLKTPDSNAFATDPIELKQLVNQIRDIELSVKKRKYRLEIQKEELEFKNQILYRCIANRDISINEKLSDCDIIYLRYDKGLEARYYYENRNCLKLTKNIKKGDIITHDVITHYYEN
jgi:sialic acid synthase SpsE